MPLQKLQFRSGVNREGTTLANEGGWYDCDKVRFRSGFPEKIGGWTVLSYTTFLGVCRSLWAWLTLKSFNLMGVGTNAKFYIESGGVYYDVTPLRETNLNTTTFSADTSAPYSAFIIVTDSNADSLQVGDFVTFSSAASLGGNITAGVLNQEYQIQTVISNTSYTIVARAAGASLNGYSFTVNTTNSTITLTLPIGNTVANGNTVTLVIGAGAPGGLGYAVTYYLVNVATIDTTSKTCQLSLTNGGASITLTSEGVGLQSLYLTVESTASDSGTGGAATDAAYQISTGYPIYTVGTGWGAGPWNAGSITNPWAHGWGTGYTTGFGLQLRLWSQSNFGEDLLFSPRGSALYLWQPGSGATPAVTTRGTLVSGTDVPSKINEIMVSDSTRITIAFGCDDYGTYGTNPQDPMLIRWTAQESYTDWTPDPTNQAGSYRLSHGSVIIGALQTRQEINVWTDAAVYSMQYLGPPYVWGFTLLSDNISIASPNAMATASGVVYWMGTDKFYIYSGRVETLPCSVRTYIFNDINKDQFFQIQAGTNEAYSEVWWFYCSISGPDNTGTPENPNTTIDRYVIFNYLDRVWYYGSLDRTAWLDSALRPYPMAATSNNLVVYHEASVDDGTTNPPSPISCYVQSSDFDIGDGHNYGFIWRMIPDVTFDASTTPSPEYPVVTFTMRPRQNPGSGYSTSYNDPVTSAQSYAGEQTYNVQQFTEIVYTRARGRQMALKVSSDGLGVQWQLGVPRIDVRPDGRRA